MKSSKNHKMQRRTVIILLFFLLAAIGFIIALSQGRKQDYPAYGGEPYVLINDGKPRFRRWQITKEPFERYGELDRLGRCTTAFACIGQDLMPEGPRGSIGAVKPTGWRQVKYPGIIDEDPPYLYNRCHLIAFQLAGENANERNLVTGTRYMNVTGMQPWENQVAAYVRRTGNHVMYRVTPVFEGQELVCRGVQMEAWSVEDQGAGICFNIFVYNVQPGIEIDYRTGNSEAIEGGK